MHAIIEYSLRFYQIKPRFHRVCSSDFVTDRWQDSLYQSCNGSTRCFTTPFTLSGTALTDFQSMTIMRNLARRAMIDARNLFF